MKRFPASIPRKMFWDEEVGGCTHCPECGTSLEKVRQTYVLAVRKHGEIHPFIVGTDRGYFCEVCPLVVLNRDEFADLAMLGLDQGSSAEFAVLGIVDLDAVPEEKRSTPLGDDDNPVPLVKFTNQGEKEPATKPPARSHRRRKSTRRRKKPRK